MRRAWLSTVATALCAVTANTQQVAASPAGMSVGTRPIAAKSTDGSWTGKLKFWKKDQTAPLSFTPEATPKPSAEISPWQHPVKYFSATMSETPIAESLRRDRAERPVAEPADSIALSTPTGPATPQYFISMAQLSERQGNVVYARQQLQQGLAMWPTDVELLRAAARMEDRQGQLPLAERLYQHAVAANPQHAGALNDLGLCLARQGKFEQSVQAIEQAINLQPDKALYRNNAATVLVEMRQDQKALAHLSAVHGPAVANYNLGRLLVDRGRPHEAIVYFQTAIQVDPTMESAHAAIAQLYGTPMTAGTQFAGEPIAPQQNVTPTAGPQLVPQQSAVEPAFPTTARGPAFGTSSYVPPTGYYPTTSAPSTPLAITPVYQTATAPRYLPPVQPTVPAGSAPATMVR